MRILVDRFIYQGLRYTPRRHAAPDQDIYRGTQDQDEKRSVSSNLRTVLADNDGLLPAWSANTFYARLHDLVAEPYRLSEVHQSRTPGAPPAALRPWRATAAAARKPPHRARHRNDQRKARAAKQPSSRRSSINRARSPKRALRVTRNSLWPTLAADLPRLGLAPIGRMGRIGSRPHTEEAAIRKMPTPQEPKIWLLVRELTSVPDYVGVLQYGSRIRGAQNIDSDYDLIVVTASPVGIERLHTQRIDLNFLTLEELRTILRRLKERQQLPWGTMLANVDVLHDTTGQLAELSARIASSIEDQPVYTDATAGLRYLVWHFVKNADEASTSRPLEASSRLFSAISAIAAAYCFTTSQP